ncbi:MAG TPA: hypothetical protein VFK57_08960 [Vicinamibacterales bacterium]|nr:hypothetical protein [Vicinamibacterales bacterium]
MSYPADTRDCQFDTVYGGRTTPPPGQALSYGQALFVGPPPRTALAAVVRRMVVHQRVGPLLGLVLPENVRLHREFRCIPLCRVGDDVPFPIDVVTGFDLGDPSVDVLAEQGQRLGEVVLLDAIRGVTRLAGGHWAVVYANSLPRFAAGRSDPAGRIAAVTGIPMTLAEFKATLSSPQPPARASRALLALWHDGRGDWDQAHDTAQHIEDPDGAWIHAYLHRKEGDAGNAAYWYRRAGKPIASGSLDAEWAAIAEAMLAAAGSDPR